MIIAQPQYPAIQIDDSEADCVQLWQTGREDINVNIIQRDKLPEVIEKLQLILLKTTN